MRVNTVPPDRIRQGITRSPADPTPTPVKTPLLVPVTCHTPAAANPPARPRRRRVVKTTPTLRRGRRHLTGLMQSYNNKERRHVSRGGLLLRHHHPSEGDFFRNERVVGTYATVREGGGQEAYHDSLGWDNTQPWGVHREVGKRCFMRRPERVRSSSVSAQVKKGGTFVGYVPGLVWKRVYPGRGRKWVIRKAAIIHSSVVLSILNPFRISLLVGY